MIAGLEDASGGEIYIDGTLVNDVPPKDRDIAMVFQNYALYPHMTVFREHVLRPASAPRARAQIRERVEHAARILDIMDLLDRRPKQLSGGQRQRVAMGRAIVRNPRSSCSTSPCPTLTPAARPDAHRDQARSSEGQDHYRVCDARPVEAMTLADRVVVMNAGRIEQIGTPQELYHKPRTRFVAGFIGSPAMNFVPCRLDHNAPGLSVRLSDALSFSVPASRTARYQPHVGKDLVFGLRPEHVTDPRYERSELHPFTVTLDVVEPMGMETMVYFKLDGAEVCAGWSRGASPRRGSRCGCAPI